MSSIPEAASVLLARGPGSAEVFVVRRADALRFLGGFHAFPGGKAAPEDADRRTAAARELFEETGVLLARRPDGAFPASGPELDQLRTDLLAERLPFSELLARLGVTIRPDDLAVAGVLVTPPFSSVRFDTTFYVAVLPPNQTAEVWPGELTSGEWMPADAALQTWENGDILLSPPTVALLRAVRGRPVEELPGRIAPLLDALAAGALHPIFFSPAVLMIPLHCRGLPPTTHTNAYLVGDNPAYLLDPGPDDAAEQARLFDLLDERLRGGRLGGVVLTHQHPDHVGAAAACAARYRAPVVAHPKTAAALAGRVAVDRRLEDGATLDLGRAPHGRPWRLEALHTPGHAAGHLAFFEATYRLLFAGDMVSTMSSIIIAPPEGDLALYLESLGRLRTLPTRLLLPAHGPPSARPEAVLDERVAHRRKREAQLVEALAAGPRRVADLAQDLYRGLPAELMRLGELQTLAGLRKLQREGRAEAGGGEADAEWRLCNPTGETP
jgi:glyoxylase-like metal-dependent hydrolase (beta-lactamase superfamily II)/8-oxo-dGTP pyrophosphatase MutT (NUDIX family)